jgi:hypothetical protein
VFIGLLAAALSSLALAVLLSNVVVLGISIVIDILIGAYIALLLYTRQQAAVQRRTVVPLEPTAATDAEDLDSDLAAPTVRIIGG